jgi:alpha/beta hydrolase fold/Adenylate and Guanylate cyclase catalytic domain
MDDLRAVMDAAGSERAVLMGSSEGGPMCMLFAATYPERTAGLVLYGTYATNTKTPDNPWGSFPADPVELERVIEERLRDWGKPVDALGWSPGLAAERDYLEWSATSDRLGASPGAARALARMNGAIDVRHVLPAINVPTLVLHRTGDRNCSVELGRYLARHIAGAQYMEFPGDDHSLYIGDSDAIMDEIEEFVTGARPAAEPDRTLATVLFTDIVGSIEHAARVGDRQWRTLLDSHHHLVRRALSRFRGREIHTTGDGFLATFDGPARAIRCAAAIREGVQRLGIDLRAGLHTGEIELMGADIGGLAVHIGARVAAEAGPGEVLVSSTVKDLVAGSGIAFEDGARAP